MELLERNNYLAALDDHFHHVEEGKGQAFFLTGEAGIGKTSLVNHWVESKQHKAFIYTGACDSLFTPRPLGPLYDIAEQIDQHMTELLINEKDRALIFASLITHLTRSEKPVILVFEDIHWADEATLDLIKFLARRINRLRCLFIATYRDDEIHMRHPLASLFGEIPSGHFSKVQLTRFSKQLVDLLASRTGNLSGQQLFQLTDGNPFYVMEILSAGNSEIPGRVKDSILARFYSAGEETRALWELLSILPSGRIEPHITERIEQDFGTRLDECILAGVIISRPGYLSFKHELFRITIEESLSPAKRRGLHKKMVEIIQSGPADAVNLTQLVHHARYADDRELVALLAPKAANEASLIGSHREAAKLYATAIEYASSHDVELANLYERYAYECYLIYQVPDAIAAQKKALDIWRRHQVILREGDALRFLSRLWWYAGDQSQALTFAQQSIEVLEHKLLSPTKERALAYSNLAQLAMLSEDQDAALRWGNKAINLATELNASEILSHALNNVGAALIKDLSHEKEGEEKLNQSLAIALENGYHEHAARAYVNLTFSFIVIKKYEKALSTIAIGIKYCEERDLDFLTYYILSCKSRLLFETGLWKEADMIARQLLPNPNHRLVTIVILGILARLEMRLGRFEEAGKLITQVKVLAQNIRELHRVMPILSAELELAWLTGGPIPLDEIQDVENTFFHDNGNSWYYSELMYWKKKCGLPIEEKTNIPFVLPYSLDLTGDWNGAAEAWKKIGCPYEQALSLMEGGVEESQKQGLQLLDDLGATAASSLFRTRLKLKGVRNLPRGPRESTLNNPAQLTDRQIDILHLLREGLQNKEIADKLFISPKTVDHHISALLSKLEVSSRTKAVLEAQKLGILK